MYFLVLETFNNVKSILFTTICSTNFDYIYQQPSFQYYLTPLLSQLQLPSISQSARCVKHLDTLKEEASTDSFGKLNIWWRNTLLVRILKSKLIFALLYKFKPQISLLSTEMMTLISLGHCNNSEIHGKYFTKCHGFK